MALDALGKWSLIDAYVLVLMMVAFHFHITQPGKDQPQVRPDGESTHEVFATVRIATPKDAYLCMGPRVLHQFITLSFFVPELLL
jgi:hypothetical protein